MPIVVDPSKTTALRSGSSHVAVLHHEAGGELVKMSRRKIGVDPNHDKERENKKSGLHIVLVLRRF